MKGVPEMFGCMVFGDNVMRERLPKDTYNAVKKTKETGEGLDPKVANIVASAMKDWAIENGATHFTHWFQPMTGITAEKHDSFITPSDDGVIMEFSGKELIKGEPDASSFPSGGLRTTFEARGYTAWDPTAYAFIKDGSLCIPTAFCSYTGDALDKKTPLLRSMAAVSKQAVRVLHALGEKDVLNVTATVGAEQEYFLIDKSHYGKRKDLVYCGKTLIGMRPPKGQELDDHYFGALKPRVSQFMKELDEELWKLGVLSKTKHNEAAPAQYELAPVFTSANTAADHNQLTMEMMRKIADRHNLCCILDEKPFAGVNGSGKHNNWSLTTDKGENLLKPGKHPESNYRFLLFLSAVIKAVDDYQDIIRISAASASNDLRLGASEAPPAIISMFIGEDLQDILESIATGKEYSAHKREKMAAGVNVLPLFSKDTTDRNRTSPFAFTGNKFEFRMPGSAFSISDANVMINTAVAESLRVFADRLESSENKDLEILSIIKDTVNKHRRILFNGNNYCDEWVAEAQKRGLLNLKTTVDAAPHYMDAKNVELFKVHGVFSETELHSRYEIMLESYTKTVRIEALCLSDMITKGIIPVILQYERDVAEGAHHKKSAFPNISVKCEEQVLSEVSELTDNLYDEVHVLEKLSKEAKETEDLYERARIYCDKVRPCMDRCRIFCDKLERIVGKKYWPYPSYGELLFSI